MSGFEFLKQAFHCTGSKFVTKCGVRAAPYTTSISEYHNDADILKFMGCAEK